MITLKNIMLSWLGLIALTFTSVYVIEVIGNYTAFIFTVLAIVFVKGQLITDVFMELRDAPAKWRFLLMAYVLLIPLIISVIYIL